MLGEGYYLVYPLQVAQTSPFGGDTTHRRAGRLAFLVQVWRPLNPTDIVIPCSFLMANGPGACDNASKKEHGITRRWRHGTCTPDGGRRKSHG
jgi:hypothetical protein